MARWRIGWRGLALALACALPATAETTLPIFDAHMHYSQADWDAVSPDEVLTRMDRAGVARALVSSSPDDGTLKLHAIDAGRFAPELRPYRAGVGAGDWARDPATAAYLAERLERGIYLGIGEFHLFDAAEAEGEAAKAAIRLARERDILLHVHSGAAPVEALFRQEPRLRILWAHAGFSAGADEVRRLMAAYPRLWAELSFRAGDVAPGGTLDPAWRALFLKYPDRFLVGTDTYVTERWASYEGLVAQHRGWLEQLPEAVAKAIAYANAVSLYGDGGRAELSR